MGYKTDCKGIPPYHIYLDFWDRGDFTLYDNLCDVCKHSVKLWHRYPCDWWFVMRAGCSVWNSCTSTLKLDA